MVPSLPSKTDIVKTQSGVLVLSTIQLTILGTKNNQKRIRVIYFKYNKNQRLNWESVTKVVMVSAYDIFVKSNQQDLFCVMFLSLPSLYFCFVAGLDKVHLALLRGYGGKIWQSCLIMVALILLHFSLFSVKFEFHHCNLERIFGQPHFSGVLEYYR